MARTLLIVESPSKANTLKKYLGRGFEVLASYGHIRDLEAKEGAVDPEHEFRMRYALVERNRKHVDAIVKAAEQADQILLATDPDREGEAIAWHLAEILRGKKQLKGKPVRRVVFYEITQSAVKEGVQQPRDISMPLVNAQQARRALDHLVGFNLSPLLWRKIGPSLSAGRVQSPALRLIVEREQEIEAFKSQEYWTIHLDSHKSDDKFTSRLVQLKGEKVEQFTVTTADQQAQLVQALTKSAKGQATVQRVERKPKSRFPAAPFITSTLQQEAVRKLGMTAERAMRTAQQLYEGVDIGDGTVGLITYMRTDSTNLADEAVREIRAYVTEHFSAEYLPKSPVEYRSKAKNAQEAHEAIRPTSIQRSPDELRNYLTPDQVRLYEMIWKRTLACQMAPARYDTTAVDIVVGKNEALFRATGQILVFPGFIAVYQEGQDDATEEGDERLPALEQGERLPVDRIFGEQHFTLPPPRYTEASLVKKLEEFGIGRPSTYANIISTLQDRGYALLDKKRFLPTDLGRLVNGFLTAHFDHYVDYDFTARMEDQLDFISNGEREWLPVLSEFWGAFSHDLENKQGVPRGSPLNEACPKCGSALYLQNSKRGLFVGCSAYPKCDYTRPWGALPEGQLNLGKDPATGLDVLLLRGPYGFYAQLGPTVEGSETKPRRASWPKNLPVAAADLETAVKVLSLPRILGNHPQTGKPVEANVGRFGPYVKHDGAYKSIPKSESVYEIGLERAVELLAAPKAGGPAAAGGKQLGFHPIDNKPVLLMSGKYGPYVKHGNVNATVPSEMNVQELTLDDAVDLLAERAARELAKTGSTARPVVSTLRAAASARSGRSDGVRQAGRGTGRAQPAARGRAASPQAKPATPGGAKPAGRRAPAGRGANQAGASASGRRRPR
jgi:DNA topoisomerase-1